MPRRSPPRSLTLEEKAVWEQVTRSVKALRPANEEKVSSVAVDDDISGSQQQETGQVSYTALFTAPIFPLPSPSLQTPLRRALRRGKIAIDRRLDLHGYRELEAHQVLNAFLARTRSEGARIVLVITGKSGILYRLVPLWLQEMPARLLVSAFGEADSRHGGAGALYVHLRK
jgi:DNA-nicking Smr family endonuclease